MVARLCQFNCRSASGTLLEAFLCRRLLELPIVLVLLASVALSVNQCLARCARPLPTPLIKAHSVSESCRRILGMCSRIEKLRARRVCAVDAISAFINASRQLTCNKYRPHILSHYRILPLLLHSIRPNHGKVHIDLIRIEEKDLPATLWRVKALIRGRALKEAAHIVCADPMTVAGCFDEFFTTATVAAADHTGLCHDGVEVGIGADRPRQGSRKVRSYGAAVSGCEVSWKMSELKCAKHSLVKVRRSVCVAGCAGVTQMVRGSCNHYQVKSVQGRW